MSEKKTYSVRLKPELMKEIRLLAVNKERPLTDIMEEAMTDLLRKYGAEEKAENEKSSD